MERFDKFIAGFICGLIGPFLGLFIYWKLNFSIMTFEGFWDNVSTSSSLAALISLCLIANLIFFYLFLNREMIKATRGVIGATFVYGAIMIYIKFF